MRRLHEKPNKQTREAYLRNTSERTGWAVYEGIPLETNFPFVPRAEQSNNQIPRNINFQLVLNMSIVPNALNLAKAHTAVAKALMGEEGTDLGFQIYLINGQGVDATLLDPKYPLCWDATLATAYYGHAIDSDQRGSELRIFIYNNNDGELNRSPDEILDIMMRVWKAMIDAGVEIGYVAAPVGCVAIACEEGIVCPFSWSILRSHEGEFGALLAGPNPFNLPNPFPLIRIAGTDLQHYNITMDNVEDIAKRRQAYLAQHNQQTEKNIRGKIEEVRRYNIGSKPDYYQRLVDYLDKGVRLKALLQNTVTAEKCDANEAARVKALLKETIEFLRWCLPRQGTLQPLLPALKPIEELGQELLNYNRGSYAVFAERFEQLKEQIDLLKTALQNQSEDIKAAIDKQLIQIIQAYKQRPDMIRSLVQMQCLSEANADADLQKFIYSDPTTIQEIFVQLHVHLGEKNPLRPSDQIAHHRLIKRVAKAVPAATYEEPIEEVELRPFERPSSSWSIDRLFACFKTCWPTRQAEYAPVALESSTAVNRTSKMDLL